MNKRIKVILSLSAVLFLGMILLLVTTNSKTKGQVSSTEKEESEYHSKLAKTVFDDPEFAEAPSPEELELAQAEVLWPFAQEKKPNRKEQVKEEWRDFAAKYPKNFYIPREIKQRLSEKEEKEQLDLLDDFTAMDASFSSSVASSKWDTGNPPNEPSSKPEAAKQKRYFDYKIYELESRIQMVEYWMETKKPSAEVKQNAEKDLKLWRTELSSLKEVRNQVPNT
ncbi:MAG: hypothetical protein O9301_07090 [Leptospira sp.]|nr:hypothetical protein [Leptospira sp.]